MDTNQAANTTTFTATPANAAPSATTPANVAPSAATNEDDLEEGELVATPALLLQKDPSGKVSSDSIYGDLIDCIRQVQDETNSHKVKRAAVAMAFAKLNPLVKFQDIVSAAAELALVKVGGAMSNSWIALASDDAQEDANSMLLSPGLSETAAPTFRSNSELIDTEKPWCLTLRYNKSFKFFNELNEFTDDTVTIVRRTEPNQYFIRSCIGPFPTSSAADKYYQRKFGHLNVRPRFTTTPEISMEQTAVEKTRRTGRV